METHPDDIEKVLLRILVPADADAERIPRSLPIVHFREDRGSFPSSDGSESFGDERFAH